MKMPFGKHKGEEISQIDKKYLEWVINNLEDINQELYDEIESELIERAAEEDQRFCYGRR
jgi:hypothetical protein